MRSTVRIFYCVLVAIMATSMSPVHPAVGAEAPTNREPSVSIADVGATGDGVSLNTDLIQSAIDQLAAEGGGTLVIPQGIFLSGAIFLKPGVNLRLDEGAVLKGSTDKKDYPKMKTRIEGHFAQWLPALLNADGVHGLRIEGPGTLDGNGASFWEEFRTRHKANPQTTNLDVERPRLALIQNSDDVRISGVTFKDSGFWNLHLYRCTNVVVEKSRFEVPEGIKCPSTDGTDIDSCQHVTIRGCTYRVDDDCVCLKGSKGPSAMDDKDSPPVEHIRVSDCTFERGHGVMTLGSEATVVRDVVLENCKVTGSINVVKFKLRPDTPQHYEDIHYRNLSLDNVGGTILSVEPWKQYFDLKGQAPPRSVVRNVSVSNARGRYGSLGTIEGNPNQTEITDIMLRDIDVKLKNEKLKVMQAENFRAEDVIINGKPFAP